MSWIKPAFGEDGPSDASPAKTSKISNISKTDTENTLQDIDFTSSWLETYKPKCTKELVFDTKKIQELEQWLRKVMSLNSTSKLLLLTGPPGCGKTTTFHTLCKDSGFKVIEWITPLDRSASDFDNCTSNFQYPVSGAQLFKENLSRVTRYKSCLVPNTSRHVLLVKDFPNAFIQRPPVFHDILESLWESFLFPVVFICSTNYIYNELFPYSIKRKFLIHTITFNPVTAKRVCKVLKNIISNRSKSNFKEESISDSTLSHISCTCQGDLRNAILRLHLKAVGTSIRSKKKKDIKALEAVEKVATDERIDFFCTLGRVLYPKRIESDQGLRFVHSVDAIVENFESEPGGFLSQLHENYPSRIGDIEDLSKAARRLATSDILRSRWQDRDIFNHYSLAVAVRGLMVSNRTPQKAKFESFRKSHTSRMEVYNKAVELEGKTLFSHLGYTNYDYFVDVLPFAKLLMADINRDQLQYVGKHCSFSEDMSRI